MPRIKDGHLNCVVYLYRSRHEANEGINIGGSGFLVAVPAERLPPPAGFGYVVTNRHVFNEGATVLRINTRDGKFDIFETKKSDWILSKADDLAICMVPGLNAAGFLVSTVRRDMLLTKAKVQAENFGPGDEVILLGRFINQEGKERNLPSVRFGHISRMPFEPIEYNGTFQESFLCEVKSIGGFSGSPVFLAPESNSGRPEDSTLGDEAPLLGVDWAHIQNWETARDEHGRELPHIRFPTNTGMMAVVPAWKLDELFDDPSTVESRRVHEEREIQRRKSPKVLLDTAVSAVSPLPNDASPTHGEDFMRLVDSAARKPARED